MDGDTEKGISSEEQVWDTLGDSNGKDSWAERTCPRQPLCTGLDAGCGGPKAAIWEALKHLSEYPTPCP